MQAPGLRQEVVWGPCGTQNVLKFTLMDQASEFPVSEFLGQKRAALGWNHCPDIRILYGYPKRQVLIASHSSISHKQVPPHIELVSATCTCILLPLCNVSTQIPALRAPAGILPSGAVKVLCSRHGLWPAPSPQPLVTVSPM